MKQSVALLSILATVFCASAQTAQTRPAFDVTSVKPRAGGAQYLAFHGVPGGVHLEGPLSFLIRFAYAVQDYQLEGGPGWIHSENYVVEGKAASTPSQQEIKSMLQTMLEDRFALKMHRETKEGSVYSLFVAKGVEDEAVGRGLLRQSPPRQAAGTRDDSLRLPPRTRYPRFERCISRSPGGLPFVDHGPPRC